MMTDLVPYLIGAALMLVSHRLGIKLPLMPDPTPVAPVAPAPGGSADVEASEFLAWALKVKAGVIRLDDHDKETLKLISTALKEIYP